MNQLGWYSMVGNGRQEREAGKGGSWSHSIPMSGMQCSVLSSHFTHSGLPAQPIGHWCSHAGWV